MHKLPLIEYDGKAFDFTGFSIEQGEGGLSLFYTNGELIHHSLNAELLMQNIWTRTIVDRRPDWPDYMPVEVLLLRNLVDNGL